MSKVEMLKPVSQDSSVRSWPNRQISKLKAWALHLKTEVQILAAAARDPRVPWVAKLVVALVVAYALSPIDLIPDFIPVLGYLDELILLPLGIALAIKLIPNEILADHRARIDEQSANKKPSPTGAAVVITIWLAAVALIVWWFV